MNTSRGFTLIETMVVVTLLGIVVVAAAPSFRSFIATINTKSIAFDLINDMATARSEAIKRNANTTITPVSGNWALGWQITVGNELLGARDAAGSAITIKGTTAGITFRPSGRLSDDSANENLKWSVTSDISGANARCVVITPTGAARAKNGAC